MSLKISSFRAVGRPQAAVEEILDELKNEVAGPLRLRADGIVKKLDDGKDNLAEVLDECEVGNNTYQAL